MWATSGENGDLLMPLKATGDEKTIRENLETIARYRQALALENPNTDSVLRGKFTLDLLKQDAQGAWVTAEPEVAGGQVVYTEGDSIGFRVASKHDAAVFVALVDFGLTGGGGRRSAHRGRRRHRRRSWALVSRTASGRSSRPPPRVTWDAGFPFIDNVDHSLDAEAIETVKLFITEQPADFSVIEQQGVRGADGRQGVAAGDLLQHAFQGRPTRGIEMAPGHPGGLDHRVGAPSWCGAAPRPSCVRDGQPLALGGATLVTKGLSGTATTQFGKKGETRRVGW